MSVNSSSSNGSFLEVYCLITPPSSFIVTSFNIIYILLLLPLCSAILYHGLQQWRLKRSTSSAVTMSHSDSFTYNMATMELISVFGCFLSCYGVYMEDPNMFKVWNFLSSSFWFGTTFFHVLTCVEHYLAVVHPVTYLGLRRERGTRIRNVTIGCAWLLCFVGMSLAVNESVYVIADFFLLSLSFIIISFCSISVLRVLIRPGPGKQAGGRERVDQSKRRAFYTIVAILGALLLRFAMALALDVLSTLGEINECVLIATGYYCILPNSLVLPLLSPNRKGKSVCCRNNHTG